MGEYIVVSIIIYVYEVARLFFWVNKLHVRAEVSKVYKLAESNLGRTL